MELVADGYRVTRLYPKSELYGLVAQTRRCLVSIPSNIAEGYTRGHRSEYVQFLLIAFASGAELETLLLIAKSVECLNEVDFERLNRHLDEVMRMLNKLIEKLKTRP